MAPFGEQPGAGQRRRRVAVLGGTGFVGRWLAATLENAGHHVVRVARHQPPDAGAAPVCAVDLATATVDAIAELLVAARVDTIVNAAGGAWGLTDEQLVGANLTLLENVIAAADALPVSPRLVQLGSVHEYGLVPVGTSITEEHEPRPVNVYAQLKLRCTEAVVAASRIGRVDGVSLRIGNITGPGQPPESLLGVVMRQLWAAHVDGRSAVLRMASLGSLRDFVNLTDAAAAIAAAVTVPALPDRVFNIGTGTATSAREMVRLLVEVSGVPAELVETAASGVESTWQQMCVDRARRHLGWSPRSDLADGVKQMWEHHVETKAAAGGSPGKPPPEPHGPAPVRR